MSRLINLTGQRFGRLTVVKQNGISSNRTALWLCRCECGQEKTIDGQRIRSGTTRSCGCLHSDIMKVLGLKNYLNDAAGRKRRSDAIRKGTMFAKKLKAISMAMLLVLLLGGCGISLSIGTDTQQIRSQFLCTDIAMKLLEMSRQYDMQMGLAGTPEHKQMLGRIADGFMDDYRALAAKDECWRKL